MKLLFKIIICSVGVIGLTGCGRDESSPQSGRAEIPASQEQTNNLNATPDNEGILQGERSFVEESDYVNSGSEYELESDWSEQSKLASFNGEPVIQSDFSSSDETQASNLQNWTNEEDNNEGVDLYDSIGTGQSDELGFTGVESYWSGEELVKEDTNFLIASTSTSGVLAGSHKHLPPKDRWTAAAIARKEAGTIAQGQADVMHAILNRTQASAYGCTSISECVNMPGQYEPTFDNPGQWKTINSPQTAALAAGVSVEEILQADRNLQNQSLRSNAEAHVKCFTDFQGMSQKKFKQAGDVDRGDGHNFFGNFYPNSGNGNC